MSIMNLAKMWERGSGGGSCLLNSVGFWSLLIIALLHHKIHGLVHREATRLLTRRKLLERVMTNIAGARTQAKKFANQNDLSSDVQEVRENIKDLGDSVGHMASRQYERAQDVATDAIQGTGDAIQHNPLTAIGIGLGVGFLLGRSLGGRH